MTKRQPPPGISDQDWKATPTSVQTAVYMLLRVVDELQQAVAQSQKRISQLEEQVGKNSRNSSMPPSSNPLNMKKPPAKVKEKRKAGGQPGHVGHDRPLKPPEEVDHFVVSKPISCQACGALLLGEDPQPQRHQVCELPPIVPEVIEYQAHTLYCLHCGQANCAEWPREMPPGRFGPRVQALVGVLSGRYHSSCF